MILKKKLTLEQKLQNKDPYHNVFVAEVGYWSMGSNIILY